MSTQTKTAGEINIADKLFSINKRIIKDFDKFNKIEIASLDIKKIKKITMAEVEGQPLISIYPCDGSPAKTFLMDQPINVGDSSDGGVFTSGKDIAVIVKAINAKASQELNQVEALVKKIRSEIASNGTVVDSLS